MPRAGLRRRSSGVNSCESLLVGQDGCVEFWWPRKVTKQVLVADQIDGRETGDCVVGAVAASESVCAAKIAVAVAAALWAQLLPSHSPNRNLIERLRRLIKRRSLYGRVRSR